MNLKPSAGEVTLSPITSTFTVSNYRCSLALRADGSISAEWSPMHCGLSPEELGLYLAGRNRFVAGLGAIIDGRELSVDVVADRLMVNGAAAVVEAVATATAAPQRKRIAIWKDPVTGRLRSTKGQGQ